MTGAVLLDPTVPDPKGTILRAELEDLEWDPDATIAQGRAVSTWNADVPLTVLSHDPALAIAEGTWTEADQERWSAGQREYAALTPSGTQRDVTDATHYRSHPEVVLDAIRDVLPGAPAR